MSFKKRIMMILLSVIIIFMIYIGFSNSIYMFDINKVNSINEERSERLELKQILKIYTGITDRMICHQHLVDGDNLYIVFTKGYDAPWKQNDRSYVMKINLKSGEITKFYLGKGYILHEMNILLVLLDNVLYVNTTDGIFLLDKNLKQLDLLDQFYIKPAAEYRSGCKLYPHTSITILKDDKTKKHYISFLKPIDVQEYLSSAIGGPSNDIIWDKSIYDISGNLLYSSDSYNYFEPVIYNDKVYYQDKRSFNIRSDSLATIYYYDLIQNTTKTTNLKAYYNQFYIYDDRLFSIGNNNIICICLITERTLWTVNIPSLTKDSSFFYFGKNSIVLSRNRILNIDNENGAISYLTYKYISGNYRDVLIRRGYRSISPNKDSFISGMQEDNLFIFSVAEQFCDIKRLYKSHKRYFINKHNGEIIFQPDKGGFISSYDRNFYIMNYNMNLDMDSYKNKGEITIRKYVYKQ